LAFVITVILHNCLLVDFTIQIRGDQQLEQEWNRSRSGFRVAIFFEKPEQDPDPDFIFTNKSCFCDLKQAIPAS